MSPARSACALRATTILVVRSDFRGACGLRGVFGQRAANRLREYLPGNQEVKSDVRCS